MSIDAVVALMTNARSTRDVYLSMRFQISVDVEV